MQPVQPEHPAGGSGLAETDLAAARKGDPEAIARLYRAFAPWVHRYFVGHLRDRHLAEDLTANVFVDVIQALPTFRGPVSALGGWLFRIARHDLYDYWRRQARTPERSLEEHIPEAESAAGGEDPEELALDRVEKGRVLSALRYLSPDQQDVLLLRLGANLTAPEIAGVLGKTTGAVKALQHRALANLYRLLGTAPPYPSDAPERLTAREEA